MNPATLLYRQVHPAFVQDGQVTSQAFRPAEAHHGKLSVYDGSLISAEGAWQHFTQVQRRQSAGVVAVSVADCESLSLPVVPSPEVFPEHCDIHFQGLSVKATQQKAKLLRDRAMHRGWQFYAD